MNPNSPPRGLRQDAGDLAAGAAPDESELPAQGIETTRGILECQLTHFPDESELPAQGIETGLEGRVGILPRNRMNPNSPPRGLRHSSS